MHSTRSSVRQPGTGRYADLGIRTGGERSRKVSVSKDARAISVSRSTAQVRTTTHSVVSVHSISPPASVSTAATSLSTASARPLQSMHCAHSNVPPPAAVPTPCSPPSLTIHRTPSNLLLPNHSPWCAQGSRPTTPWEEDARGQITASTPTPNSPPSPEAPASPSRPPSPAPAKAPCSRTPQTKSGWMKISSRSL